MCIINVCLNVQLLIFFYKGRLFFIYSCYKGYVFILLINSIKNIIMFDMIGIY